MRLLATTPAGAPLPRGLFRHGGAAPAGALDLSASLNPLGPPPSVVRLLREADALVGRYPEPYAESLAARLAQEYGVAPECVVVGNGANEVIHAAARALRPTRVAIVEPTYTEYLRASLLAGATVDHWFPDGPDLEPAPFDPGPAEVVWLGNPNNPTGRLWPTGQLTAWLEQSRDRISIVDEAFLPLARGAGPGLAPEAAQRSNLIVVRSLTKSFALPGLRLGCLVAEPTLASRVRDQLPPWSVNGLAQAAGLAALDDADYRARTTAWVDGMESRDFAERLRAEWPGIEVLPSSANFVLVRLAEPGAAGWADRLAERGVIVRRADNFVGLDGRYLRLAVGGATEHRRLWEALRPGS